MSICEAARHFGAITCENFGNILRADGFCNTEGPSQSCFCKSSIYSKFITMKEILLTFGYVQHNNQMSRGISAKHKIIFALMVITTVLLIVWAMYVNYRYVAEEKNATIMADLVLYGWKLVVQAV
jgi:fumarate reductase subunit D